MKRYKVLMGSHFHSDGKEYKAGQIISCEEDLPSLFIGKFTEVQGLTTEDSVKEVKATVVTAKFPEAANLGLDVTFTKGAGYTILDNGEQVNDGLLPTRADVSKFLEEYKA